MTGSTQPPPPPPPPPQPQPQPQQQTQHQQAQQEQQQQHQLNSAQPFSSRGRGMVLQPLIPGYSVPFADGALLFAAALLSLVAHEAGHAAAAVADGVRYVPVVSCMHNLYECIQHYNS